MKVKLKQAEHTIEEIEREMHIHVAWCVRLSLMKILYSDDSDIWHTPFDDEFFI
jgi:hypothetical protein